MITLYLIQFPNTPKNTSQYFSHQCIHSTPKREKIKETNNSLKGDAKLANQVLFIELSVKKFQHNHLMIFHASQLHSAIFDQISTSSIGLATFYSTERKYGPYVHLFSIVGLKNKATVHKSPPWLDFSSSFKILEVAFFNMPIWVNSCIADAN